MYVLNLFDSMTDDQRLFSGVKLGASKNYGNFKSILILGKLSVHETLCILLSIQIQALSMFLLRSQQLYDQNC